MLRISFLMLALLLQCSLVQASLLSKFSVREGNALSDTPGFHSNQFGTLSLGIDVQSKKSPVLLEVGISRFVLRNDSSSAEVIGGRLDGTVDIIEMLEKEKKPLSIRFGSGLLIGGFETGLLAPCFYFELKLQLKDTFLLSTGAGTILTTSIGEEAKLIQQPYLQALSLTYRL